LRVAWARNLNILTGLWAGRGSAAPSRRGPARSRSVV